MVGVLEKKKKGSRCWYDVVEVVVEDLFVCFVMKKKKTFVLSRCLRVLYTQRCVICAGFRPPEMRGLCRFVAGGNRPASPMTGGFLEDSSHTSEKHA